MNRLSRRSGFTLVELVVVILVIVFVLMLLIPWNGGAREAARRAACLSNYKQLGLGFLNMESVLKRFPSSSHVTRDADGKILAVDGWSWCVDILPYMEAKALRDMLDMENGKPLQPHPDAAAIGRDPHAEALGIVMAEFHCPSFNGEEYVNPRTEAEAITNYKAMGATHIESLNVASPSPTVPKYAPDSDIHPDGAIYPGSAYGTEAFKIDGTSNTIMLVETKEQHVARWTVGNECTLVGLPPVVTFAQDYPYYHPTGYTADLFWGKSTIPPGNNKTYLNWNYEKNPYDDGGISTPSAAGPIKYGPSSDHGAITNHLAVDGSVHSISNEIDAALYMFMITRNNDDPMPGWDY